MKNEGFEVLKLKKDNFFILKTFSMKNEGFEFEVLKPKKDNFLNFKDFFGEE